MNTHLDNYLQMINREKIGQLEFEKRQLEENISNLVEKNNQLNVQAKQLRLIMLGMLAEKLTVRLSIDPIVVDQVNIDMFNLGQELAGQAANMVCTKIEERLGTPLVDLHHALFHINYLEGQLQRHNIPFSQWEMKDVHKKIMDKGYDSV